MLGWSGNVDNGVDTGVLVFAWTGVVETLVCGGGRKSGPRVPQALSAVEVISKTENVSSQRIG